MTLLTMTDQSVIFQTMAKTAKRPAKAALARPDKIGPAQTGRSAVRTIAATRQDARAAKTAARRDAILEAALDEFSAKGFASARLDDVAKRAGVAKGTIYLYFADKESLFQELIRAKMVPVVGSLELALRDRTAAARGRRAGDRDFRPRGLRHPAQAGDPAHDQRGAALSGARRVLLSRGAVAPAQGAARAAAPARTSAARLPTTRWSRFPQLLGAPGIIAIVWSGLFDRFEPLDVRAMMRAYFDNLFGAGRAA